MKRIYFAILLIVINIVTDLFNLHLGSANGFTFSSILLAVATGLLVYFIVEEHLK